MVTNIQIRGKLKYYTKPYGRQWKWRYQVHGRIVEPELQIPKGLEGVKIIDPLRPETLPPKEQLPKWTPPRRHPFLESFFPPLTIKDHPHYNQQPIKMFDRSVKFHAGLEQVSLLTKTKLVDRLPNSIDLKLADELIDSKKDDELIKSYIKQALAFDATKEQCNGYNPVTDVKFHIGREFATPYNRQMRIILDNLVRLVNVKIFKKYPNQIENRIQTDNCPQLTILTRGDDVLQIKRNYDLIISSKDKLPQVASAAEIEQTRKHTFIDMYPIFPTVDLKEENIYDLTKPYLSGLERNIHTFVHLNDDDFTVEEDLSRLMMFAFGCAYGQYLSQKPAIDEEGRLQNPIVVNGVSVQNQRFNFLTYQLNTANLDDNSGVKNICFYDAQNNEIYSNRPTRDKLPFLTHKNLQRMALSHLEYNQDVFRKFLAMLLVNAVSAKTK